MKASVKQVINPSGMNRLIIDSYSEAAPTIKSKLTDLDSTLSFPRSSTYPSSPQYCQIVIDTTMNVSEMKDWLDGNTSGHIDVVIHGKHYRNP